MSTMIDSRRRPPASSTSLPISQDDTRGRRRASARSLSSGSITPMEDEDDKPKRSTRGRNPLPPTKGPLFPPLPPKPNRPKPSPKHSSADSRGNEDDADEPGPVAGPSRTPRNSTSPTKRRVPRSSTPDAEKRHFPSGSGTSLTPPPPSDPIDVDALLQSVVGGSGRRSRRRSHGVNIDVKLELMEDGEQEADVEQTPKQTRTTRGRLVPPASTGTTPTGSDQGANVRTSLGRRRRGEEQLLLDDHLLPEEIRRIGTAGNKRKSQGETVAEKQEEPEDEPESTGMEPVVIIESTRDHIDAAADEQEGEIEVDEDAVDDTTEEPPATDDIIEQSLVDPDEEAVDDEDGDEVTRCVCQLEDGDPLMVACDKCNVWQHGPCVGIWADEEAPDEYFCERCRPELHGPLRKWMRSKGRNIAHFTPPSPENLKALHAPNDRYPPSQSKRWITAPPKGKSHSRSRAKKTPSPSEVGEGRRQSRRGEPAVSQPPGPASHREKSAKTEGSRTGRDQRRGSSNGRRLSRGSGSQARDSRSPTVMVNGQKEKEPRKRSTMNSRDAAFEDAVQAAIEASRREMAGDEEEGAEPEDADPVAEEKKRETERKAKGKRKREDDTDSHDLHPASHAAAHPKVKHPNQYTYRPKPILASVAVAAPAAPSPARRVAQGSTPTPQIPPPALHEHGTRRAGALATGAREAPFVAVSVTHLGWHMPDYLSSFNDIFPSPIPVPLEVRSPRTLPPIPKNHFTHQKYGPFSEIRDEEGRGNLELPPPPAEREPAGKKGETHTEPPARLKYPQRRVTTTEMRKRVLHMLNFCDRVEREEERRRERKGRIGVPDAEVLAIAEDVEEAPPEDHGLDANGDVEMANWHDQAGPSTQAAETKKRGKSTSPQPKPTSTSSGPSAAQLLLELTAEIRDFNETWARGGFAQQNGVPAGGYGGYSPVPPSSATFGQPNGWPTSSLARDVTGPDEDEEGGDDGDDEGGEGGEASGSGSGGAGANSRDEAQGDAEGPVHSKASGLAAEPETRDTSPAKDDGATDIDTGVNGDEQHLEHAPNGAAVEVYREGEVSTVVATPAEDQAAEAIEEEAGRGGEADHPSKGAIDLERVGQEQGGAELDSQEAVAAAAAEEDVVMAE